MQEGNRRIVIYEPGQETGQTTLGAPTRLPPTKHVVYAIRKDRVSPGEDLLLGEIQAGRWLREYTIRRESISVYPHEDFWVEDEDGIELDIVAVAEKSSGPWERHLTLICARRNTGKQK